MDATNLYWTESTVFEAPLGSTSDVMLAMDASATGPLVVDSTNVYWADDNGTVSMVPIAGGAVTTLYSNALVGTSGGIAVDTTNVYWTQTQNGTVMTVPIGGGKATALASGLTTPTSIVVDATAVYWTDTVSSVWKLAK